ncbi:hypothetical protein HU200_054155 [Digitaria exilis]|uniref:Uncharacterized protein n=1 Tax=Digitaria exilis TaxID=1010633 RepID=A0A835AL01_9POAL|nr:hypothetical protein HU200_054155 [Digitaria exilis]
MDRFHSLSGNGTVAATKGTRSLAILVVRSIWCERNARIFNAQEKSITTIVNEIKDVARLWGTAGAKHLAALVAPIFSE